MVLPFPSLAGSGVTSALGAKVLSGGTSQVAQWVENLPAMQGTQETLVQSLSGGGWGVEDPLEEGMATCSSILDWRIPWTEEPGGLQSTGLQRVGRN